MKTLEHRYLGDRNTPQDIRDLRQSSFDFHQELGYPIIHKHRWTLKDHEEGLVERCPLHDDIYNVDPTWDAICFGTGFVGGFRDAEIVYISLGDAPVDAIKITPQGVLTLDQHPMMTAPWLPTMQDGDLLIAATFDPVTWEIDDLGDRFLLRMVTQVTVRGPDIPRKRRGAQGKPLIVHQESTVDKLPYGHPLYVVPLVFDPNDIPPIPGFASRNISWRVRGDETFTHYTNTVVNYRITGMSVPLASSTSDPVDFLITGYGTPVVSDATEFRVVGIPADGDIIFHW